jgi:hypothetical protein
MQRAPLARRKDILNEVPACDTTGSGHFMSERLYFDLVNSQATFLLDYGASHRARDSRFAQ